jgi:hypothetical protein
VTEQSCHLHQFVHIIAEFPVEEVAEPQWNIKSQIQDQSSPNYMLQGHRKILQTCNTNSGAQASEDSSELAALQS